MPPVLLLIDDSDRRAALRIGRISGRLPAETESSLQAKGIRTADEATARQLGWTTAQPNRLSITELLAAMKLLTGTANPNTKIRAMAIFSIFASAGQTSGSTVVRIDIRGDLYDAATGSSVNTWNIPRQSFSIGNDCNAVCYEEAIADHAHEIGGVVADELIIQLGKLPKISRS